MLSDSSCITLATQELATARFALSLAYFISPEISPVPIPFYRTLHCYACFTRPHTRTCTNMYHPYRNDVSSITLSSFEYFVSIGAGSDILCVQSGHGSLRNRNVRYGQIKCPG